MMDKYEDKVQNYYTETQMIASIKWECERNQVTFRKKEIKQMLLEDHLEATVNKTMRIYKYSSVRAIMRKLY